MRFGVQVHNKLKRQNCGAAGIAVDEERVNRNFGGCPSATGGLVVSRLLKHTGDCADRAAMHYALFLCPNPGMQIFLFDFNCLINIFRFGGVN